MKYNKHCSGVPVNFYTSFKSQSRGCIADMSTRRMYFSVRLLDTSPWVYKPPTSKKKTSLGVIGGVSEKCRPMSRGMDGHSQGGTIQPFPLILSEGGYTLLLHVSVVHCVYRLFHQVQLKMSFSTKIQTKEHDNFITNECFFLYIYFYS